MSSDLTVYLISCLSTPVLLFLISVIFKRFPIKNRNHFWGYRTRRSKSSQAAWDEANRYSFQLLFEFSVALIVLAVLLWGLLASRIGLLNLVWINMAFLFTAVGAVIFLTERRLKKMSETVKQEL